MVGVEVDVSHDVHGILFEKTVNAFLLLSRLKRDNASPLRHRIEHGHLLHRRVVGNQL